MIYLIGVVIVCVALALLVAVLLARVDDTD
jgi:hypothetical protein